MEEIISRELLEILPILENPEITDSDTAIICRRGEKFFNVDEAIFMGNLSMILPFHPTQPAND